LSSVSQFGNASPERWQHIRFIFDEVEAAPSGQRASLLELRCQGDAALLAELRSLLEASDAEEALTERISEEARRREDSAFVSRMIGPYELGRLLGRGGMGTVYLAHRADGQFHQQVAIKLIDVPLAADLFRKQFRMERQILAGLSHPFIGRLLDGGVSANGELYLVMEYIDGISLFNYCREHRLSLRGRLLLFKKICSAVQYAHQNLVIHRDLKPDNILVLQDETPRLLDFGTAKLLSPLPEDSASEFTMQGLRSFTPQYASPEQVLGKAIGTSSDIYSLGVILFHLLADVPPYTLRDSSTGEMLRIICTEQPPKPSSVAVSQEVPDTDLDSIALMALRKEPEERYLTGDQFAADIQAWLEGRPVVARRGTLRYRAVKFAQRNKLALSAAALLLAAVLCGVAGVLWQSRAANLQRARAEANAQEMRELSDNFLQEIDKAVRELPGSTPVRQLMVQRVLEHLDHIAATGTEDRLTRLYLAKAYIHLAVLQGDPYEQNIGDAPGALVSLNKALAFAEGLRTAYPNDAAVMGALASIFNTQSRVFFGIGKSQEAVASINEAIAILAKEADNPRATRDQVAGAADAYDLLGDYLGEPETPSVGDYPSALKAYRTSLDLYNRSLTMDPNFVQAKREIAIYHLKVGDILLLADPTRAKEELRQSLALWDALPATDRSSATDKRTILYCKIGLGKALMRTREYLPSISTFDEARESIEQSVASDPKDFRAQVDLTGILGDEADTYIDMLDPSLNTLGREMRREYMRRATQLLQDSIAATQKVVAIDPDNEMTAAYLAYEGGLKATLDQSASSSSDDVQLATASVAALRKLASPNGASSEILFRATSIMLTILPLRLRDTRPTVQYAERLAALSHHTDPTSLLLLAQAYRADGQLEKANATAHEGLNLLPALQSGTPAVRCRVLLEQVISASHSKAERKVAD
jgi:tetratricopeptide (TPR) repeat protein